MSGKILHKEALCKKPLREWVELITPNRKHTMRELSLTPPKYCPKTKMGGASEASMIRDH